jgi:hypothetical protein
MRGSLLSFARRLLSLGAVIVVSSGFIRGALPVARAQAPDSIFRDGFDSCGTPGVDLRLVTDPVVAVLGGDADPFLDNCETARVTLVAENHGTVPLTNVRVVGINSSSHPGSLPTTTLPATIAASLPPCGTAQLPLDFQPHGMTFDATLLVQVTVTADQLAPDTRTAVARVTHAELDWAFAASRTFSFEADMDGWSVVDGVFSRQAVGAAGTSFHLSSAEFQINQCDVVRSPLVSLTAGSTLSMFTRYRTDAGVLPPLDRANVGVFDAERESRTTIAPDGGTVYELAGSPGGSCVTAGQPGWAGESPGFPSFQSAAWSASALNPGGVFTGRLVHLDVAYGTDADVSSEGFDFDQVTLTNCLHAVPDSQPCL